MGQTQPIYAAVLADKCARETVADQSIVFDCERHDFIFTPPRSSRQGLGSEARLLYGRCPAALPSADCKGGVRIFPPVVVLDSCHNDKEAD
jgi:hypothetical protein